MTRKTHSLQTEYWRAITHKDAQYDGLFFYAVRTTGVFCRPSCGARQPRRENVEFFASTMKAAEAGFRPCLRCKPLEADGAESQAAMVQQVCRFLEKNSGETISLETLGVAFGMNAHHLQRVFKRILGLSPRQYLEAIRLRQLKTHLRKGETVTSAQFEVGYNSSSRLYERAASHLGMTPASYRKGGKDARIVTTTVPTPLGQLLIAATARGLCAVRLGDSADELQKELKVEFPRAEILEDNRRLKTYIEPLIRFLTGQQTSLPLPLDIQATAFQQRVWQALQAIPFGETRSYTEIATAIAQPQAVRAVASACAANPVALVIPCHRVVRGDGSLSGYRWGVERKKALLAHEAQTKL